MTMEYRRKKAHREAQLNKQRRRAALALVIAFAVLWFVKGGFFSLTTNASFAEFDYVTVNTGDTLWSIASRYKPYGQDIRDFMRVVASYNGLEDLSVQEGQLLKIPCGQ